MRRLTSMLAAVLLALALAPVSAAATDDRSAEVQEALAERLASGEPGELLVMVRADDYATAERAARATGLRLQPGFPAIGVAAGVGTVDEVRDVIQQPGVRYVEMDQPIEFATDTSHVATRGAELLDGAGPVYDGTGISIAINDSGIDGNHPAFQLPDGTSKVARNLKSVCPLTDVIVGPEAGADACFVDVPGNDSDTTSAGGHGTHVAGIAAGVFDETVDGTRVHGAAPGATLIGLSVGATLWVYSGYQGMYWVLEHHDDPCAGNPVPTYPTGCPPIKVVNNSWGPPGGGEFDEDSIATVLQRALVEQGVVVVWAAGNAGGNGSKNRVNPPAQDPTPGVLGVANYDDLDSGTWAGELHSTSSRGEEGRPETYPDISAPGTTILQACTYALTICRAHGDVRYPWYAEISGTSMAAPHIAGIVAQLFDAQPHAMPAEIEDAVEDTAYKFSFGGAYEDDPYNPDDTTSYDKGHGLVDALSAAELLTGTDLDGNGVVSDGASGDGDGGSEPTSTECGDPALTDTAGDAVGVDTDPVDIVTADVSSDDAADLRFVVSVADLRAEPPAPGDGEWVELRFRLDADGSGAEPYEILARRSVVVGQAFALRDGDGSTVATLDGSFDVGTDTVTVELPASVLGATTDGSVEGLEVWTRYDYATRLGFLVADQASTPCVHSIGSSSDADGEASTGELSVEATASDDRLQRGEEVTFTAAVDGHDGEVIYTWDLGDGTSASGQSVTHAYSDDGDYTATVTVEDADGSTASDSVTVSVRGGPPEHASGQEDRGGRPELLHTVAAASSSPVGGGPVVLAVALLIVTAWALRSATRARLR